MKIKKITMTDIARAAGVSQTSVSLILNGKENSTFSPATVEKVHSAARSLGYQPRLAPTPARCARNIMVLSVNGTNPYYTTMLQSIEQEAYRQRYHVFSCHSYRDPQLESDYLDLALKMKVSGLICLSYPHCPEKLHEVALQIPVVCICDKEEGLSVDIVEMQHSASGALLIDHLASLGHKRIAMVTSALEENRGRMAYMDGLRAQMERHGLADSFAVYMAEAHPFAEMEDANADYSIGYSLLQDEAVYRSGTTAFVCTNDSMALGVVDAILEKGYRIPEDFSVCGSDNLLYSQLRAISLTTVDHRMETKGKSAMELLMRKMDLLRDNRPDGLSDQFTIKYQPRLVVRGSTGPAPQKPPKPHK